MIERRKYKRFDISIPLTITLMGTLSSLPPIDVQTENISLGGLSLVIRIKIKRKNTWLSVEEGEDSGKKIPYLLLKDRILELVLKIPPEDRVIKARGKVRWYTRGLRADFYHLRAGVLIEEMGREDRERWFEFLKTLYYSRSRRALRMETDRKKQAVTTQSTVNLLR